MARPISARWVLTQTWCGSAPLRSVSQKASAVALGAGRTRAESQPVCAATSQHQHQADRQQPGHRRAERASHDAARAWRAGSTSLAMISPNGPALRTCRCGRPVVALSGSSGKTSSAKR